VDDVLVLRAHDARGLSRMMTISFAVHIGVVAVALLAPRSWFTEEHPPAKIMTISLGGTEGPRATGLTAIGGRPVEQAVPEPKRPEPIKPAAPKSDVMTVPQKATPKPEPAKPVETPQPPAPTTRLPTTGKEVTAGTSRADTGAKGQGTGLTFGGGGGTNATMDVAADFCCMDYARKIVELIERDWASAQAMRGETILAFTILRDGSIINVHVDKSAGSLLDRVSRSALTSASAHFPPLPKEYTESELTIHLKFPYGSR
jgi:outer membrane biosynthesis protein TonB